MKIHITFAVVTEGYARCKIKNQHIIIQKCVTQICIIEELQDSENFAEINKINCENFVFL